MTLVEALEHIGAHMGDYNDEDNGYLVTAVRDGRFEIEWYAADEDGNCPDKPTNYWFFWLEGQR